MLSSQKKPRICLVTISDLRYEANIFRKARTLVAAGFEVHLLAAYHPDLDEQLWQGIQLRRLKLPKQPTFWRFFIFVLKSFFTLLPQKADLFIAYDYLPLVPLRLKAVFNPCNYIYDSVELLAGLNSLVGRPVRQKIWLWYERFGLQRCKAAFTVCESDAQELQRLYPHLNVAGFVRNIPEFQPVPHSDFLRQTYGIPLQNKIGIYQGMIFEGRGLKEILTAAKDITNLSLVFVGDGPLLPELKQMARNFAMAHRVVFTGLVPFQQLKQYTASADFGFTVISGKGLSYYHALPNKLFEYIQAEIPVIGSNYPEIAAIIDQEQIGLTVDPTNPAEISQAILQMLDTTVYEQFKLRLKKIAQKYTWKEEAKRYLRIVESAMNGENLPTQIR